MTTKYIKRTTSKDKKKISLFFEYQNYTSYSRSFWPKVKKEVNKLFLQEPDDGYKRERTGESIKKTINDNDNDSNTWEEKIYQVKI